MYKSRSICARGPYSGTELARILFDILQYLFCLRVRKLTQTAGPFTRLSTLNCTPALSIILPATPSRASISLSIVPLPIPPKLGLQEQTPILSNLGVMRAVRAPARAAPAQASAPAWPPPMTTTSYGLCESQDQLKFGIAVLIENDNYGHGKR